MLDMKIFLWKYGEGLKSLSALQQIQSSLKVAGVFCISTLHCLEAKMSLVIKYDVDIFACVPCLSTSLKKFRRKIDSKIEFVDFCLNWPNVI